MDLPLGVSAVSGGIPCYFPEDSLVALRNTVFMRVLAQKFFLPGKVP